MPEWPEHLRTGLASITSGPPSRFLLDDIRQDIRYTARMLGKQRVFTAAAVMTLALGIGATTAIFSVAKGVLINPLPYQCGVTQDRPPAQRRRLSRISQPGAPWSD